jgi:hypothetical protein
MIVAASAFADSQGISIGAASVGRFHGDPDMVPGDDDTIDAVKDLGCRCVCEFKLRSNSAFNQLLDFCGWHRLTDPARCFRPRKAVLK